MKGLVLACRLLGRAWRGGELRLLAAALVLAVGSMTAVDFFTDRVHLGLEAQAAALLGGDGVIASSRRLPQSLVRRAAELGLATAEVLEFPSMVSGGGRSRLASVEAVSAAYPLRGRLRISDRPFAAGKPAPRGGPPPGSVWLEGRLLGALGLAVGDTIRLGQSELRVAAVLVNEPARVSAALFALAPRLLLSLQDLQATGLLQPGSRFHYRLLVAGPAEARAAFREAAAPLLKPGERLAGVEAGRPEVRQALQRARRFLGLAALVGVFLAGLAAALAMRRFMLCHLDTCALLRCLGCGRGEILGLYTGQLVLLALAAALAGGMLGYLAQQGLAVLLGSLLSLSLPPPSLTPLVTGLAVALLMTLGVAVPTLLYLVRVPALRVLRRELGSVPAPGLLTAAAGLAAFAVLVFQQAGDSHLGGYMLAGIVLSLIALGAAAWIAIKALGALRSRLPLVLHFALGALHRRHVASALQAAALGIGITVLLLLMVVRDDLLAGWRASLPPAAPNRFLINILPGQTGALKDFFAEQGLQAPRFYPVVRGRLAAIAGKAVGPEDFQDARARRLAARTFNLSWMEVPPDYNRLVAGRWWTREDAPAQFSVEAGLARTLGIRLGDELRFRVAGRALQGRVTSLREVDWDSFRVNFFVVAPPALLSGFPATYICSFHLPRGRGEVLNRLVAHFPNVTVIDVAAIMDQVRAMMQRVSLAVEYVFFFTLAAGVLVMLAAIQVTVDERIHEFVVLRTLGAARRQLQGGLLAEFLVLGLVAGGVAVLAAVALGHGLAGGLFELDFRPRWGALLGGAGLAALGIGAAGYSAVRPVLHRPPLQTLLERA